MDTPAESKSQVRALTTTSFAVLSVLALREHPTYELTHQARISLHYIWPRAESNLYAEAKRLVVAGLATARDERKGGRRRTVYAITPAGRAALAEWLTRPSTRQRYESEALLKVFFAENGTTADLLRSIRTLRDDSLAAVEHFHAFADRYDAGEGDHPERFALSALAARLVGEQHAATARWADWAEAVVSRWDTPSAGSAQWGVETLRATGQPFPVDDDRTLEG